MARDDQTYPNLDSLPLEDYDHLPLGDLTSRVNIGRFHVTTKTASGATLISEATTSELATRTRWLGAL